MNSANPLKCAVRFVGLDEGARDLLVKALRSAGVKLADKRGAFDLLLLIGSSEASHEQLLIAEAETRNVRRMILVGSSEIWGPPLAARLGLDALALPNDLCGLPPTGEIGAILTRWAREGSQNAADHFRLDQLRGAEPASLPTLPLSQKPVRERRKPAKGPSFLSRLFKKRKGRKTRLEMVRTSAYFDADHYLICNPDVAKAGTDPARHYLETGWKEGRNPGPSFDNDSYLLANKDVAEAGVNPLVHYLEDGKFEGRAIRGARREKKKWEEEKSHLIARELAPATKVYRGSPIDEPDAERPDAALKWIESDSGTLFAKHLAAASGFASVPRRALIASDLEADDLFFSGMANLCSRWSGLNDGMILAFQCDPAREGKVVLCGQGRIGHGSAVVAHSLASRLDPILFAHLDLDGGLIAARILRFPSLLRGGLHEAEALDMLSKKALGPFALDATIDLAGRKRTAIVEIRAGSELGTEPIRQPDLTDWAHRIFSVRIDAQPSKGEASDLILPGHALPTIAALAVLASEERSSDLKDVDIIIHGSDLSQPHVRLFLPAMLAAQGDWTRFRHALAGQPATIMRVPAEPGAARWLRPGAPNKQGTPDAIAWLIDMSGTSAHLEASLAALARQQGSEQFFLIPIGELSAPITDSLAPFAGRILLDGNIEERIGASGAELVGWLGTGIVFQDAGTISALAAALEADSATSVSCPLLSAERHGKSIQVRPVDLGMTDGQPLADQHFITPLLHGQRLAVDRPPSSFWLARAAAIFGDHPNRVRHLVCGEVTAIRKGEGSAAPVALPDASVGEAMRFERVVA